MKSIIPRFIKRFVNRFRKKAAPVMTKEQDLSNVYYEMQTVKRSIHGLNDAELYDYCIMDIQMHQRHDLDALYDKLVMGGKLTPEERQELENFYLLATMEFGVIA